MDSFYASCELSKKPELKSEPFVVGADPREGKGRGVVLSCNYIARKFGLRSAMPISKAWQLCPQARYVPPNFELYSEISTKVMTLLRTFADKMEQVSVDEAYLDVTNRLTQISEKSNGVITDDQIKKLASSIKASVSEICGITCSIGAAASKIVAKIATDMNKPDGLTVVSPAEALEFLGPLPVGKIPGVGKVTEGILKEKFKIETISDLRKTSPEDLGDNFGRGGLWLLEASSGTDHSEIIERWDPVSQSSETTFDEDEGDYSKIKQVMQDVAREVHKRVTSDGYVFRNIGIKIRFTGFQTKTRSKSLGAYTDSLEILLREVEKLLSEFTDSGKKVRLIGVRVSMLKKNEAEQSSLLQWETTGEEATEHQEQFYENPGSLPFWTESSGQASQ